jgi:hypothetical protein
MADKAVKNQPGDTAHRRPAGQQADGNEPQKCRSGGSVRTWSPSRPQDAPERAKESPATMFDKLAAAAAAHDGEAAGGILWGHELAPVGGQ